MDERGGNAGIDAAAQAEDHALFADFSPNFTNRLVEVIVHRPVAAASANVMDKVADDFRAARRVYNFGMKLQAKKLFAPMFNGGVIGVVCSRDTLEACGKLRKFVAVGIPNLKGLWQCDKERACAIANGRSEEHTSELQS